MHYEEFHRIKRLQPYVFAEVNRLKLAARHRGADIIDFGMGNPDSPIPPHIVEKMIEVISDPKTHGYSVSKGIKGLRKAQVGYYQRRFGVPLDEENEVVVTIGSKEGIANLAQAMTSPGDIILVPSPSYPIHPYGFMIAGAALRYLVVPFDSPRSYTEVFMEQLSRAVQFSVPKPLLLVLSYPCNPTAQVVDLDFYKEVVAFCRKHGIYILSDLAYAEIYFDDNNPPPSVLQVEGAMEIAIEFTSMSKTYSMAGCRIGFAVGNRHLIASLARIKSYVDYGAFTPIQVAAATALNGPQECVTQIRALYKERRDVLLSGLKQAGWDVPVPQASMFAWAPIPESHRAMGSVAFSKDLLEHAEVAVAPGLGFGEHGEGYVRIGLVENVHRIRQATRNIKQYLKQGSVV
jgi:alanine-synthesizing transaminase